MQASLRYRADDLFLVSFMFIQQRLIVACWLMENPDPFVNQIPHLFIPQCRSCQIKKNDVGL